MTNHLWARLLIPPCFLLLSPTLVRADNESAEDKYESDTQEHLQVLEQPSTPRDIRDPRINPLGTAGWVTLNVLLDWQVTARLQIGLRLENLADKAYREHASGIDAAGRNVGL